MIKWNIFWKNDIMNVLEKYRKIESLNIAKKQK